MYVCSGETRNQLPDFEIHCRSLAESFKDADYICLDTQYGILAYKVPFGLSLGNNDKPLKGTFMFSFSIYLCSSLQLLKYQVIFYCLIYVRYY
jgi:hypothetical protein